MMQHHDVKILPDRQSILRPAVFVLLLITLMVTGCEEIIEFETQNKGGDIVIFGRMTDGLAGNQVNVSITSPFDKPPVPIEFAEVVVFDEAGNREIYHETTKPGVYEPRNLTLERSEGKSYFCFYSNH